MKSFMAVLPHPYHSVSQMNGTFSIGNLPPGTYTLVAWHEKYGTAGAADHRRSERVEGGEFHVQGISVRRSVRLGRQPRPPMPLTPERTEAGGTWLRDDNSE